MGSIETDEKLETCLNKFLVPVLLKLVEPSKTIQDKVLELLSHISKRVKASTVIQLPMNDLFDQLHDSQLPAIVHNFTLVYIKMGYYRLSPEKQIQYLPNLIKFFSRKPQTQRKILMQLFMKGLINFKAPTNDEEKHKCFFSNLSCDMKEVILSAMINYLFLPYSRVQNESETLFVVTPPGLSESSLKSLIGEVPLNADELEMIKFSIVQVAGCSIFSVTDVACVLLIASTDPRHKPDDWGHPGVIKKLYEIFLGTTAAEKNIQPSERRMPCGIQLKNKILSLFVKSTESSKYFPACIQVVFEGLFGTNTNSKLKLSTLSFVHHLCFSSSQQQFDLMNSLLNSAMLKVSQNEEEEIKVRVQAYLAIGKLGRRNPNIATNISFVQKLFDILSMSEGDLSSGVQDCLLMFTPSLKSLDATKTLQLEAIILQHVEEGNRLSRLVAVRYAATVFPTNHIPSKYALLLACSDVNENISSEALRSLHLNNVENAVDKNMPLFSDLMQFIGSKVKGRFDNSKEEASKNKVMFFRKATYIELLKYAMKCLQKDAIELHDSDTSEQVVFPCVAKYANTILQEKCFSDNPIKIFVNLIRQFLSFHTEASVLRCLLEIVAVTRDYTCPDFIGQEAWMEEAMFSSDEAVSKSAAELYAIIIVSCYSPQEIFSVINHLVNNFSNQVLEKQQGSLLCYGFLMNLLVTKFKDKPLETADFIKTSLLSALKYIIYKLEDTKQLSLSLAAGFVLSEIARCGCLVEFPESEDCDELNADHISKISIIKLLLKKVHSNSDNQKLKEKAVLCLGMICVGDGQLKHKEVIIEGLMQSAAAKQYDFHWCVGETLVLVGQGFRSCEHQDRWLSGRKDEMPSLEESPTEITTILNLLLSSCMKSSNPHMRQAGSIWMLILMKKVGDWPEVQLQIMEIQAAFISLLGESNDLTQDVVSKALAVVYEKGSEEVKKELVTCLIESLTSGKKRKLDVSENASLFEEGFLGKSPEGQNLSTYKELCSIANDLNQPDLIYKFLNLANHNATWNFQKGAAKGFSSIASQASEQLTPHLDKILPKLYRYQYDPNPRVQSAMREIWNNLVSDQDKVISKYIKEILQDLQQNMINPQWRTRESSCYALNELLRSWQLSDCLDILPDLWKAAFKVRDDIKESVRNAAESALQSLSKATVKFCDGLSGSVSALMAEKMTGLILPVLLDYGLASSVEEVRSVSLSTLMKMSKTSGLLLKPHIDTLVVALLESISTLEPQLLNYLSLHAAHDQAALDKCIQLTDDTVLVNLIPKMCNMLKNGIGLGTKICAADVIVSLVQKCPQDMTAYTGKLLIVLFGGLNDRNASLRRSYSNAVGQVAKISKDSSVTKLISRLHEWYFEKDDDTLRETCGLVISSLNSASPDIISHHNSDILPLVFLAMHKFVVNSENQILHQEHSYWEDVWQESTPGMEIGIKLYASEIIELIKKSLISSSWTIRESGARAIVTVAKKLNNQIEHKQLYTLLSSLLSAFSGRTWSGKETLLTALSTLCTSCKHVLLVAVEDKELKMENVVEIVLKECKRENIKYKIEAICCLSNLVECYNIEVFAHVIDLLEPIILKEDTVGDDDDSDILFKQELLKVSFDALGKCWPNDSKAQGLFQDSVCKIYMKSIGSNSWQVEVSTVQSINRFFRRWYVFKDEFCLQDNSDLASEFLSNIMPTLCQFLSNFKNGTLRSEALCLVEGLIKHIKDCNHTNIIKDASYKEELVAKLNHISSSDPQIELRTRAQVLNQIISLH